jgi:hypothetical protein
LIFFLSKFIYEEGRKAFTIIDFFIYFSFDVIYHNRLDFEIDINLKKGKESIYIHKINFCQKLKLYKIINFHQNNNIKFFGSMRK